MRALARAVWGDTPPPCTRCERDANLRVEFGCDAPAPTPVVTLACGVCGGRSPDCGTCGGSNKVGFFRCPRSVVETERPDVGIMFRLFRQYREHGVLPAAGGLADQTLNVLTSFEVVEGELNRIENERRESEEREQRAEAARANRVGRMKRRSGIG